MRTYDLGKAVCKAVAGCMGFGRWAKGWVRRVPGRTLAYDGICIIADVPPGNAGQRPSLPHGEGDALVLVSYLWSVFEFQLQL